MSRYLKINVGDHFGIIDLANNPDWQNNLSSVRRSFTIVAGKDSELLTFHVSDLIRMENEFNNEYKEFFHRAVHRLKAALKLRMENSLRHEFRLKKTGANAVNLLNLVGSKHQKPDKLQTLSDIDDMQEDDGEECNIDNIH